MCVLLVGYTFLSFSVISGHVSIFLDLIKTYLDSRPKKHDYTFLLDIPTVSFQCLSQQVNVCCLDWCYPLNGINVIISKGPTPCWTCSRSPPHFSISQVCNSQLRCHLFCTGLSRADLTLILKGLTQTTQIILKKKKMNRRKNIQNPWLLFFVFEIIIQ